MIWLGKVFRILPYGYALRPREYPRRVGGYRGRQRRLAWGRNFCWWVDHERWRESGSRRNRRWDIDGPIRYISRLLLYLEMRTSCWVMAAELRAPTS